MGKGEVRAHRNAEGGDDESRAVRPDSAEKTVRDIRRATRRQYSAEEKLESLRGEASIAVGGAFIDGKVLIGDPIPLFAQGKQHDIIESCLKSKSSPDRMSCLHCSIQILCALLEFMVLIFHDPCS